MTLNFFLSSFSSLFKSKGNIKIILFASYYSFLTWTLFLTPLPSHVQKCYSTLSSVAIFAMEPEQERLHQEKKKRRRERYYHKICSWPWTWKIRIQANLIALFDSPLSLSNFDSNLNILKSYIYCEINTKKARQCVKLSYHGDRSCFLNMQCWRWHVSLLD